MKFVDFDPSVRTVKLFPRLAMTNQPTNSKRDACLRSHPRGPHTSCPEADTPQSQVRARLLRMILENERNRRGPERPNAS
jgi:hypothetical protein